MSELRARITERITTYPQRARPRPGGVQYWCLVDGVEDCRRHELGHDPTPPHDPMTAAPDRGLIACTEPAVASGRFVWGVVHPHEEPAGQLRGGDTARCASASSLRSVGSDVEAELDDSDPDVADDEVACCSLAAPEVDGVVASIELDDVDDRGGSE
jgi:hypothetical protein